jgi:hypothetical protein
MTPRLILPILCAALSGGAAVQAAVPRLHCELRYASQSWLVDAIPTRQPYEVPMQNLDGRFGFKAVLRGTPDLIESVNLYVYDLQADGAPALIQQVRHLPPFKTDAQVPALTGWNHVYSSVLGRELVYGCALQEVQP